LCDVSGSVALGSLVESAAEYQYCSAFPDSDWTAGPQGLKPRNFAGLLWHE
jgi:hypothetical protein